MSYYNAAEEQMLRKLSLRRDSTGDDDFDENVVEYFKTVKPPLLNSKTFPFANLETLKRDKERVAAKRERIYQTEKTPQAVMAEYIVKAMFEGKNFSFIDRKNSIVSVSTSEFDELFLGKDVLLWFQGVKGKNSGRELYLGIDVTTSDNSDVIIKKKDHVEENLLERGLGRLKYFYNKRDKETPSGNVTVPEIIIVFEYSDISTLRNLMVYLFKNNPLYDELKPDIKHQVDKFAANFLDKFIGELIFNLNKIRREIDYPSKPISLTKKNDLESGYAYTNDLYLHLLELRARLDESS